MTDDALDVNQMNVKPGGKERVMRDGIWNGKSQAMDFSICVSKGLCAVLEEKQSKEWKKDERTNNYMYSMQVHIY